MELTIEVRQSTIDAIKSYAAEYGNPTQVVSSACERAIEGALSGTPELLTAFALRPSAVQKLNAYAHLRGTSKEDVAIEVSETLSDLLESVLKDKIAAELGIDSAPPAPARGRQARAAAQQSLVDTTGITDGLGDDDPDPEMPPAETEAAALVPSQGGLTDKELENDMIVADPDIEAKGEAPSFGDDLAKANGAEGTFAEVAGFDKTYVDPRVAKRRKGPTKSKGRVKAMTESVENEGAGV